MRMRNARRIAALIAAAAITAVSAVGCTAQNDHRAAPRPVVLTSSQVATLRAFSSGDSAFGLNLLGTLCQADPSGNVVISPLSISSGLGLAYLGARGGTATAMARALDLPDVTAANLETGLRARSDLLSSLARPGVVFAQSNRIWTDPTLPPRQSYVAALRAAYQAKLTQVPLVSDPARARQIINAAVAAETRGHIPDLLPSGSLNGTGWVLTNALYLDAKWAHAFSRSMTAAAPFTTASGQVTAHYLNGDGFSYATDGGWSAAQLPYRGGRLKMLALLPPAGDPRVGQAGGQSGGQSGGRACALPDAGQLAALETRLKASGETAAISLPKVTLSWSGSLKQPLTALGMGVAFGPGADFAGISPQAGGIGFVQHAATLQVSEQGTVASAATGVGIGASAERIQVNLKFNRPYLMVIEDSLTGEPLMLAWVTNPAASQSAAS
jgi:serpin B